MGTNEIYTLLIKFLDGETDSLDTAIIQNLINNDAFWKNEFEILESLNCKINESAASPINAETDANWALLKSKIEFPTKTKTFKIWPSMAKYAAAAIIIFVAGWFLFGPLRDSYQDEFSTFKPGQQYNSDAFNTLNVKLTDGTEIILNKNSELIIDQNFNKTTRFVQLKGEAYFKVSKNPNKPFIAQVKNTLTKVIGTSFEIETLNEHTVLVSLYEGKVQFNTGKQNTELTNGQKIAYSIKTKTIAKQIVKNLTKDPWTEGLSFRDAKLVDIAKKLELMYSIKLIIPENKQNENYTVSFEGLNLSASLLLLEELTDSKIIKKGKDYILNP